jgi:hypothetical protein
MDDARWIGGSCQAVEQRVGGSLAQGVSVDAD